MSEWRTNGGPTSSNNGAHCGVDVHARLALLQKSILFTGLPSTECAEIAAVAQLRAFAKRKILFHEGEPVVYVYLLTSGYVKLTQLSEDGNQVILRLNGPGEVVGALGCAARSVHKWTVQAMTDCESFVWEAATFERILERYPQVRANTVRLIAIRLQELEERFRELSTEKVAPRVAHQLVRLLAQIGKPIASGVEIALSREELAQLTGTTLFTISRLFSAWQEQGLVIPRRESVLVRRADKLAHLGEGESQ